MSQNNYNNNYKVLCRRFLNNAIQNNDSSAVKRYLQLVDRLQKNNKNQYTNISKQFTNIYNDDVKYLNALFSKNNRQQKGGISGKIPQESHNILHTRRPNASALLSSQSGSLASQLQPSFGINSHTSIDYKF